ncbi:17475_t:CDS:2, partial [Gigaspora margarita]
PDSCIALKDLTSNYTNEIEFSKASKLLFSKSEVYDKVKDDESRAESDDEANS